MSLDKENMKKICLLIVFTLAVFVGLWRLEAVIGAITFLGGILAPFILGGAIAFILSVPMNRIEITICKLCSKDSNEKRQKKREKFLRPFSMILTLVLVIAVLALAVLVIFPELGRTVSGLGRTIQANVPILLDKLEELFHNNKEISYWLANLDLNWDEIIKKATNIFQSGADIVLGSTFSMVQSPMQALAFIVLFLVLQQLEGNFIYPHVVGGSVGLPSIWVLVAVTVGGSLMGIVGMLIFIPLMSVLYTLLRQDVVKRLEKKQLDIS